MTEDQVMRLIYLLLLLGVIGGSVVVASRRNLGQTLQHALIWVLIFVGGVLVYGVWEDVKDIATARQQVVTVDGAPAIEVPRSRDGHYHMVLEINDAPVRFVVDTGASDLVLTRQDAERVGLDPDALAFAGQAFTANGPVATASVVLDSVALEGSVDRDVRAVVNGGEMTQSLLGMSYLQEFGRIEIADDTLRLVR